MILLPRIVAVILFVLFCIAIVVLGVYGYNLLRSAQQVDPAVLRSQAEQFLYISIVCVSVIVLAFLIVIGRTRYISRELDKMIELNTYGDFSPELSMKKLGVIGKKITLLYFRLNALNEKKSVKISALSDLVEFLIAHTDLPLLVSDVQGKLTYVSRAYAEKYEVNRSDILNRMAHDVLPEIPFQEVVLGLDKTGMSVEREYERTTITYVPIQNRQKELSYVVWVFDRKGLVTESGRRVEIRTSRPRVSGLVRRVFSRNLRGEVSGKVER